MKRATDLADGELWKELRAAEDRIDAAYWAFSRQAKALPPVLVVPEAYDRRNECRAEITRRASVASKKK